MRGGDRFDWKMFEEYFFRNFLVESKNAVPLNEISLFFDWWLLGVAGRGGIEFNQLLS